MRCALFPIATTQNPSQYSPYNTLSCYLQPRHAGLNVMSDKAQQPCFTFLFSQSEDREERRPQKKHKFGQYACAQRSEVHPPLMHPKPACSQPSAITPSPDD
jgi:hypothetical protein